MVTFFCTYYFECSEILPTAHAIQTVLVPKIREELKKIYPGSGKDFELFFSEYFFDLHYQAKPGARTIGLDSGNLCRLAVDYRKSHVPPCVHRAP